MRLLLDTHTFMRTRCLGLPQARKMSVWYVTNNPKLSTTAQQLINDGDNEILISIASIWEIAIKYNIGKLTFKLPFEAFIFEQLKVNNFDLLDIRVERRTSQRCC